MNIFKRLRKLNGRAIFIFKGTRYRLVMDRFIHARDDYDRQVQWARAFGTKLPHDVLNTFQILAIRVKVRDEEKEFSDLNKFIEWIKHLT